MIGTEVILAGLLAVFQLSGAWVFEARAGGGGVNGKLELKEEAGMVLVTLAIDNHVHEGRGETDGKEFTVVLRHADGTGPGHAERIVLTGRLDGKMLTGSFDNGTDRGTWKGSPPFQGGDGGR